jgi:arylsulfatase
MDMANSGVQGNGEAPTSGTGEGATPPVIRAVLPIPDPQHVGLTTYDAKDPNTKYPPITMLRPPTGAPNVLIVLIDDVGFGASSAFGGPCDTPVAERLAANGL